MQLSSIPAEHCLNSGLKCIFHTINHNLRTRKQPVDTSILVGVIAEPAVTELIELVITAEANGSMSSHTVHHTFSDRNKSRSYYMG